MEGKIAFELGLGRGALREIVLGIKVADVLRPAAIAREALRQGHLYRTSTV